MDTQHSTPEPLLTRHQSLRLRKLLLQLPNLHQVGGLNVLLAGLPVGLAKSLPVGQPPNLFVATLVDRVTSDAWAELPDGSRPVLTVIENAMQMAEGSRLYQELGRLLDEVLSQSRTQGTSPFPSPSGGDVRATTSSHAANRLAAEPGPPTIEAASPPLGKDSVGTIASPDSTPAPRGGRATARRHAFIRQQMEDLERRAEALERQIRGTLVEADKIPLLHQLKGFYDEIEKLEQELGV